MLATGCLQAKHGFPELNTFVAHPSHVLASPQGKKMYSTGRSSHILHFGTVLPSSIPTLELFSVTSKDLSLYKVCIYIYIYNYIRIPCTIVRAVHLQIFYHRLIDHK